MAGDQSIYLNYKNDDLKNDLHRNIIMKIDFDNAHVRLEDTDVNAGQIWEYEIASVTSELIAAGRLDEHFALLEINRITGR